MELCSNRDYVLLDSNREYVLLYSNTVAEYTPSYLQPAHQIILRATKSGMFLGGTYGSSSVWVDRSMF